MPDFAAVDVVLVAVPDDALLRLVQVACASDSTASDRVWVHTSGVRGAGVLRDCGVRGPVGTCHPLASLTGDDHDDETLVGSFVAVGGDSVAVDHASAFARALGARAGVIPDEARVAYHLAAVLASNGVFAVLEAAAEVCRQSGIASDDLQNALARLALGSATAAWRSGVDNAMTGPVARGDAGTVARHAEWLASSCPDRVALYRALAAEQLVVADRTGLPAARARAVRHALATVETTVPTRRDGES